MNPPEDALPFQRPNRLSSDFETLIRSARDGSGDALGQLFEGCRQYLLLIAKKELAGDLQAKAGVSDLVQDTFVEVQDAFPKFTGASSEDFLAWARVILLHRLANFRRRYRAGKRDAAREVQIGGGVKASLDEVLDSSLTSPSGRAVRNEHAAMLRVALERLPEHYRTVVILRHRDNLTFAQIGQRTNRTADAARMMWCRALDQLAEALTAHEF